MAYNQEGRNLFFYALRGEHQSVIAKILAANKDYLHASLTEVTTKGIRKEPVPPLFWPVFSASTSLVKMLMKLGADSTAVLRGLLTTALSVP